MIPKLVALMALAALVGAPKAHAQQNVVSCNFVIGANGQQSCSTTLSSKAFGGTLTNSVVAVKTTGGVVALVHCYNPNSAEVVLQFFNQSAASVVLGTTAPYMIVPVTPGSTGGWALSPLAVGFSQAISVAATTTATGSTASTTAPDCNVYYN